MMLSVGEAIKMEAGIDAGMCPILHEWLQEQHRTRPEPNGVFTVRRIFSAMDTLFGSYEAWDEDEASGGWFYLVHELLQVDDPARPLQERQWLEQYQRHFVQDYPEALFIFTSMMKDRPTFPQHAASFKKLIDLGFDINAVDVTGKSVLQQTIESGNAECLYILLERGVDVTQCDYPKQLSFLNRCRLDLATADGVRLGGFHTKCPMGLPGDFNLRLKLAMLPDALQPLKQLMFP